MMYVMLVVIVMMISGTMIVLMIRNNEQEALEQNLKRAIDIIKEDTFEDGPLTMDNKEAYIKRAYNGNRVNTDSKLVFVLDYRGNVYLPEDARSLPAFTTQQVMKAAYEGSNSGVKPGIITIAGDDENAYLELAENIMVDGQVAYIILALGNINTVNDRVGQTIRIILISVVLAFFVAVVLGFVFSDFLTKPIQALSAKANDMATGRLDRPMLVRSRDEIGQLTENFNKMSKSLNETLNEITSEKNKLEIVFEHMTDGILVFDRMGMMIHSNPASVDMLKLNRQISFQEVFKPYLDVTYPEMKAMVMEETISHLVEVANRYYSIYFAKFLDQGMEAVGLICVIQDITEHKHLEEMQKEFVANVSHELRTPLTTVKTYAETLMEGSVDDEATAQRFLGVIVHEGDRMAALVQDLLELSKLDNSQVPFAMNHIALEQLAQDSVEKHRMLAEKKRQSMIYHDPEQVCKIVGDANRVEQVLKNILTNAIKYSPEGALIEVSVTEKGKYWVVGVLDNGFGIPKEDVNRIFERFYRVDKARSREMGGTGLGLAIANEIMEQHGGRIEVQSDFGKGSLFELYFPKKKDKTPSVS